LKPVGLSCATALATALGLAAFLTTSSAQAQDVIFGSAQTITGDANLIDAADTAGIVNVDAILPNGDAGFGGATGAPLTADGVTFNAATFSSTSTSDGTITLTASSSPGTFSSGSFSQYGNNANFGGGSAAFNSVMNAGGVFGTAGVITISSAALTTGDNYELQIFNYSGDGADEATTFTSGSSSVTLFDDNGSHVGEFVTATFAATGANEVIDFSYASGPYTPVVGAINLVQVVPEPSTYALMLGGALLFGLGLRRRQPAV
jgi:hypothetical protein